ncbi:hypothetical protein FOMG_15009 [Fusarium oxysporum f. sp. melonis 26406]|uniref:N-acetyltransferase domain-containing protein n=1 Tax=Fusarium oxysporum f. sp. melonis 26406 TaxID=1089452 RepID=W9Z9T5_FUSOX|nr:hypothetical protein FOMG_15009 [Fusarium oxysporum f. sp. melonis 26406]
MAFPAVSDPPPMFKTKIQDFFDSSVLRELRTIINAAYRSHDINPAGEIGERIQYDTQIVNEIGTNGFTVVMSCGDEIVGSASVKDWKPTAQENDWKPAGHYVGKSADEASAMDSAPSVRETASCEGDVEVFMVAVKPELQYRKKGIAEGLLQKFCPKETHVRVILRVVRKKK